MGVLDKIKNALFEVEYVEVEEPPKVEKKKKPKEVKVEEKKPIAKRVVLPGKREEKIEELKEEELKDDNFEARPKNETIKKTPSEDFKYMDDNDFKVEDDYEKNEPEIVKVMDKEEVSDDYNENTYYRNSREDYTSKEKSLDDYYNDSRNYENSYKEEVKPKPYETKKESKPYGMDKAFSVPMYEYGSYEKKDEKTVFKPSPIISPIYGILDKNYKKEDVVQKKDVRITTSYSRSRVSVDDVRNKALGVDMNEEIIKQPQETTFEIDDTEDDNLLVDLTDEKGKPEVKELTMGDALEYFQDLGLEYNVDYVDASKKNSQLRRVNRIEEEKYSKPSIGEVLKREVKPKEVAEETEQHADEDTFKLNTKAMDEENENKKTTPIIKDESNASSKDMQDDDDNLFDLIDSMYEEKGA
ncbi:MAG: hypothetical protein PUG33_05945 [Mollicutes bacterium]|nr:hypothetical protein [Mollicutes bacterium]